MDDEMLPENAEHGITVSALILIEEDDDLRPEKFHLDEKYTTPEVIWHKEFDSLDLDGVRKHFVVEDILAIHYAD